MLNTRVQYSPCSLLNDLICWCSICSIQLPYPYC